MRFICLLVEHLPTRAETLLNPALAQYPLVILRAWDDHVLDASPEAVAAGVGPGDSRRRVEQLCPPAIILPAREAIYQSYHDRLRAVAAAFAPAVETYALGELLIEIGELARDLPSEKAIPLLLAAQAEQAIGLTPAIGIAANKFTSGQAARQAAGEPGRVVAVPDGGERRFLSALPLTALPEPPVELLRRLSLFGISTLAGLALLPHAAFVLQFGPEMAVYHDLARGLDPRPLEPQAPPPSVTRRLALPDPTAERGLVLVALERLARRIAGRLEQSGHHAMALSLSVTTAGEIEHTAGAPLKPPTSDGQTLSRTAGRLLGKLPLAAEVTGLALTAYPLRAWHHDARQLTLFESPATLRLERLVTALGQLRKRFGDWIVRLASVLGPPVPVPIQVHTGPDGALLGLQWAGWSRPVAGIYEAWRERQTWWDEPVLRDYYQVESGGGLIFTVFRDGQGQWFLDRRRR